MFLNKTFFLGLRTFSNVNVLHKGLLLQDWVFRLGSTLCIICFQMQQKSLLAMFFSITALNDRKKHFQNHMKLWNFPIVSEDAKKSVSTDTIVRKNRTGKTEIKEALFELSANLTAILPLQAALFCFFFLCPQRGLIDFNFMRFLYSLNQDHIKTNVRFW